MDRHLLEQLVEQGLSQKKIADIVGKGQTAVRYWLCKYNLGTKRTHKCKCGEVDPKAFTNGRYVECKKCRSKRQVRLYITYKQKAIQYKGGKCKVCGYNKCAAALDFHHVNPLEKDPDWRKMRHWAFDNVKKELDKCDLVCKNCHAEIHYS